MSSGRSWDIGHGTALRKIRRRSNGRMSASRVASEIGVSRWSVERWELGRTEPPSTRLIAYLEAVGSNLTEFETCAQGRPTPQLDPVAVEVANRLRRFAE